MTDLFVQVTGRGPAVVLLHGFPFGGRSFARLQELLADRFQVFVPDLAGFGRSAAVVGDLRIPAQATRIHRWMRGRRIERAVLLGQGVGGCIAARLKVRYPDWGRGLVLMGAPSAVLPRGLEFMRVPLLGELRALLLGPSDWRRLLIQALADSKLLDSCQELLIQTAIEHKDNLKTLLKLVRSLSPCAFQELESDLARHDDVHVVCGKRAVWFGVEQATALAHRLAAPLHLLDGTGSLPALEAPEFLAGLVGELAAGARL